jgi:hypothetical protein
LKLKFVWDKLDWLGESVEDYHYPPTAYFSLKKGREFEREKDV